MARNFRELEARMSPESRARSQVLYEKHRAEMPLVQLREAQEMTQVHLAKILGVNLAQCRSWSGARICMRARCRVS